MVTICKSAQICDGCSHEFVTEYLQYQWGGSPIPPGRRGDHYDEYWVMENECPDCGHAIRQVIGKAPPPDVFIRP